MMISRAKVIKMTESGTCLVKIPVVGDKTVEAYICTPKGYSVNYLENETVFVAWLGEHDWVIIGSEYSNNSVEMNTIKTESIFAKSGKLENEVQLGDSGMTVGLLTNFYRDFIALNAEIKEDINK